MEANPPQNVCTECHISGMVLMISQEEGMEVKKVRNCLLDLLDCIWGLEAPLGPRAVPSWGSLNGIWCWWEWCQAANAVLPPPLHLQDSAASGVVEFREFRSLEGGGAALI